MLCLEIPSKSPLMRDLLEASRREGTCSRPRYQSCIRHPGHVVAWGLRGPFFPHPRTYRESPSVVRTTVSSTSSWGVAKNLWDGNTQSWRKGAMGLRGQQEPHGKGSLAHSSVSVPKNPYPRSSPGPPAPGLCLPPAHPGPQDWGAGLAVGEPGSPSACLRSAL